ncbi:MAG: hypothetical protein J5993_01845 [Clostridia bacterium]|nr:hypothetical protein [Clostridia bacterium]
MTQKINGYTEDEARELVEYIAQGKEEGKTLSYLFETFGAGHGRAKGSVRNYYYTLLKSGEKEEVRALLKDKNLHAVTIREFTDSETEQVLRDILKEKSKGYSVRRAIANLSGGDDKLMLRYQNKYRNVLKKEPERITALLKELGIEDDQERRAGLLQRRVEKEINALYDRISKSLKEENERLRMEKSLLETQVLSLQAEIACLKGYKPSHTDGTE